MPSSNTFNINPIKKLLENVVKYGKWIDPFANSSKVATITNDLNPEFNTDYNLEALDFLKLFDDLTVDGVLFDPPYSPRQIKEVYHNVGKKFTNDLYKSDYYSKLKLEISRIVKQDGIVVSFGWNSGGIGKKYGFEIQEILLVAHGGVHNDTIVVVDKKIRS